MEYKLINPINPELQPIEQVLINRGFQTKDIPHYLNVSEKDNLSSEFLKNIYEAVCLLIKHINKENNIIAVICDSDTDGFTSSAFLLNYIYKILPSAINKFQVYFHKGKTHGIEEFVEAFSPETSLVIAPDSSSEEYAIHEQLVKIGKEVLVLDHHQAKDYSSNAIVVNNQLCDYPNKALSGVGIVYKFCRYIDALLGKSCAEELLDLVAIGLTGDMMDLRTYETHYLVKIGLSDLRNPFICTMREKNSYSIGDILTPIGAAFYIVPLINAVTRVGTIEEKELLFNAMLEWKAQELVPSTKRGCKGQIETIVEQAVRICTNVKNRQTKEQDIATEAIDKIIQEEELLKHKILIVQLPPSSGIDPGVRGLIANKLMAKYKRPVALLSFTTIDGKNVWSGSARGYEKSKLKNFKKFCEDSNLITFAAGHNNAFGLGIQDKDIDKFIEYTDQVLKDIEFSPSYEVDFILSTGIINPSLILDIGSMKTLWGKGIEEALIAIESVKITPSMLTLMSRDKNPTLKIQLPNGIACIKFRSSEEEYNTLLAQDQGCVTINIVGKCEVNKYFNSITPQVIIEDYEIIDRMNYYF